ncbi:putative anaphase-promoting complex subunit 4 WD40 domain containing protein [Lyophyllum shimeji]|uniref:Anaphase-promoting complex subunit 4 WD40 domain containing protein n=1 Tax=Lyophyllum shimeji TaxID=47721 RepID=A0A9P3UM13_LYOSH|nr:putative anaphase-promoting complex subunit 4 WD40 domain containing protein [Lyophyllum shimeji]
MSGLKNSPFGKRLRAAQQDHDDEAPRRNRPRVNPIFGVAPTSTPSLDSRPNTSSSSGGPESPVDIPRVTRDYGDRFVPSRDAGDMRTSYHLMDEGGPSTPSKNRMIPSESDALKEQANALFSTILHSEVTPPSPRRPISPARPAAVASTSAVPPSTPTRRRLFAFNSPASNPATPTRRLDTPTDEAYSMSPVRAESRHILESPRRQLRSVCKTPYRVLDAPDLADDFYLNLVDWSSTNVLGVGLGSCVYLWTAHNAAVSKLCDLADSNDTISSVSWVQKGTTLAVGTLAGRLHIYDASTLQLQRTYHGAHTQRIGALAWNAHVLSSGSRDRMVHHRDVREPTTRPFKRCAGHRQEVCGLKWSGDGGPGAANLASGGNDNKVCIWDLRGSRRATGPGAGRPAGAGAGVGGGSSTSGSGDDTGPGDAPLWKFHEHTAAVKALAWDPHVAGVLATGGGTQDKHIRFWNTMNGTMLNELDTGSQVCNLIWSLTSHELVSTHGFSSTTAQNQICIWKYPTLNMVASLTGHTNRVLYLAMSPDGETIVTGAGDETLRFWNAFPKKEKTFERTRESRLDYGKLIR